jgi:hypothetical protein
MAAKIWNASEVKGRRWPASARIASPAVRHRRRSQKKCFKRSMSTVRISLIDAFHIIIRLIRCVHRRMADHFEHKLLLSATPPQRLSRELCCPHPLAAAGVTGSPNALRLDSPNIVVTVSECANELSPKLNSWGGPLRSSFLLDRQGGSRVPGLLFQRNTRWREASSQHSANRRISRLLCVRRATAV